MTRWNSVSHEGRSDIVFLSADQAAGTSALTPKNSLDVPHERCVGQKKAKLEKSFSSAAGVKKFFSQAPIISLLSTPHPGMDQPEQMATPDLLQTPNKIIMPYPEKGKGASLLVWFLASTQSSHSALLRTVLQ